MNDETAETRGPARPAEPADAAGNTPPAWTPPPGGVPQDDVPQTGGTQPPPFNVGLFRERLIRPRTGKHVAGVCAGVARATDTDPVLWRVVFAVLAVISGVGVLLYLVAWLFTPAEGDTASPAEALLGRGRSSLSPTSIVLLGLGALVSFAFIVQDGMRATVLAGAVIVGAFLLVKRGATDTSAPFAAAPAAPVAPPAPAAAADAAMPPAPPTAPAAPEQPTTPGGFRAPFAPHGPFKPQSHQFPFGNHGAPRFPHMPPPPRPPKAPKPPRERSILGRLTFFAMIVVVGLLAVLGTLGAHVATSAYFAAALAVIGAGLLVGAWFGRARGLIALALLTTAGLFVSTGVERWGGDISHSVYRPTSIKQLPDRYDFTAGDATIDLTGIDFAGQPEQSLTVTMRLGQLKVRLPGTLDTVATIDIDDGRGAILGQRDFSGNDLGRKTVTDNGTDGAGGGTLRLNIQMGVGNVEVTR